MNRSDTLGPEKLKLVKQPTIDFVRKQSISITDGQPPNLVDLFVCHELARPFGDLHNPVIDRLRPTLVIDVVDVGQACTHHDGEPGLLFDFADRTVEIGFAELMLTLGE